MNDLAEHNPQALLAAILSGYQLEIWGTHGVGHWARVWVNGLRLAEETGADREVVRLFALFHDSRRETEYRDDGHGQRGGEFARTLRGSLIHLDDDRFELLYEACRLHTDGLTTGDPTLLTCWDADRLDLRRVGIEPTPKRLGTAAGRKLIPWASQRAKVEHLDREVLSAWGFVDENSGRSSGRS